MFGEGLLTGMGVTWKHFWGKKETFCYPEEKLPMTERFRGGHLTLDHKKCIACSLCSLACPNQAIKLKIVPDAKKKRFWTLITNSANRKAPNPSVPILG